MPMVISSMDPSSALAQASAATIDCSTRSAFQPIEDTSCAISIAPASQRCACASALTVFS